MTMADSADMADLLETRRDPVAAPAFGSPFGRAMIDMVNHDTLKEITNIQEAMLSRFEKTNEKLDSFNTMSASRLQAAVGTFSHHTQLLLEAKRDLQSVFRRIRTLKAKLTERYPDSFAAVREGRERPAAAAAAAAAAGAMVGGDDGDDSSGPTSRSHDAAEDVADGPAEGEVPEGAISL
mmetsp:Transcript_31046/g.81296  ORF Transcript_31046/g.81296 Transcript_31046/m.81296 type:complete len:180 (+) Transcript_31046:106-645(+)|eukprot:CAMPEP_0182919374 /NCGR_PEP_ID=MMETSP0105_2-20130417/2669_1 /TAXON_ID=81532 ORGANISM="Acanthoeca-like sp., Strain 10tr" /NCGR_SAMPLE_ID=MMETSP0105_2 /ASSEMBLY_ACC=CAM_ASM_000205 /LENGTH=179 /DNA_ID=CAMNT_0025056541 /DNA_START=85 /DNA_END=624 /DNA_ORIENTATION=-